MNKRRSERHTKTLLSVHRQFEAIITHTSETLLSIHTFTILANTGNKFTFVCT